MMEIPLVIDGHNFESKKYVKRLGIKINNLLSFNGQVSTIYKKANQKLHALASVSHLMSKDKSRVLLKASIESQFGYCPLIWMFHSTVLNNKSKLRERALRIVTAIWNHF